eukprot:755352-Hanusia_phi.AAC.5
MGHNNPSLELSKITPPCLVCGACSTTPTIRFSYPHPEGDRDLPLLPSAITHPFLKIRVKTPVDSGLTHHPTTPTPSTFAPLPSLGMI